MRKTRTGRKSQQKPNTKPYWEMSAEELHEATKQYDEPMPGIPGRPLTRTDRALHARANRKAGRPKVGKGVRVVSLSIEKGLLERADALAQSRGMTRAALVAQGLETVLAAAG